MAEAMQHLDVEEGVLFAILATRRATATELDRSSACLKMLPLLIQRKYSERPATAVCFCN
jgi:hypothetical protein